MKITFKIAENCAQITSRRSAVNWIKSGGKPETNRRGNSQNSWVSAQWKKMRHFQINLFLRKKRWFFTFENVAESVNFSRIFSTLKPLNKVINESEHVKKMFNNPLHTSFLWSFQIKGSESWEKWVACSPWKTFSSGNVPCDLPHLDIFKAHKCQP